MQLKGVQVSVLASPTLSSQPLQWESGVTIQATDISGTYAHGLMWGFAKLPVLASPDRGMRSRGHSSWAEAPGLSQSLEEEKEKGYEGTQGKKDVTGLHAMTAMGTST